MPTETDEATYQRWLRQGQAIDAACLRLKTAMNARTPGRPWTVDVDDDYTMRLGRSGRRGVAEALSLSDQALLRAVFDADSSHMHVVGSRVTAQGVTLSSRREHLAFFIHLDADLAEGHPPAPNTLKCGVWAFPGNRDPALEEKFHRCVGRTLDSFLHPTWYDPTPQLDLLRLGYDLGFDRPRPMNQSLDQYVASLAGHNVSAYIRHMIRLQADLSDVPTDPQESK